LLERLTQHFHGDEQEAFRFLRAFTPNVIHVPVIDHIEQLDRERRIARSLTSDPSVENVRRNSQFHTMPMRAVSKVLPKITGRGLTELRGEAAYKRNGRAIRVRGPRRVKDCVGQMSLF